ncbi:MAG: hypothetical protein KAI90_06045, partial [Desulfobulbaceae bacterium]|nr:hypothetical protein [Desulfobulbaceae bacterium]
TSDIQDINNRISSTQQMSKPSDNPVHLVTALSLRSSLAEIKQYQENIIYGESMISAAESSLTQIKELIMRAKILTLQDINPSKEQSGRSCTAEEVHNLFEQAITLANTQINGKYIFGGYRTTGYDSTEPAPFIEDLVDGHRIDGNNLTIMNTMLTETVTNTTIAAGNLAINGNNLGIISTGAVINGLNMAKADNAKTALNAADPDITATLTTLNAGATATGDGGNGGGDITFNLNGVSVTVNIADNDSANDVATKTVAAINTVSSQTGVEAIVGDTTNGGVADSVVFRNVLAGDESTIEVDSYNYTGPGPADPGFGNFGPQSADNTHNTGAISIQSDESFIITSPNNVDDSILTELGLAGGGKGFMDEAGDGELIYGYRMTATDLDINGYSVGASVNDSISDIYKDASAEAKAMAINAVSTNTSVTAVVIPVYRQANGAVEAGDMDTGDLVINGVDIFTTATTILDQDSDNAFIDAINAKTAQTGISAGRHAIGSLILSAEDGRNLHIKTSALGESISHLNSTATTGSPQDKVYFGQVQLKSERSFMLETTPTVTAFEPGLATLGLDGGALSTGEPGDAAEDGKLSVISIAKQDNNVR